MESDTATSKAAVSNVATLPPTAKSYLAAWHKKQSLLAQVQALNDELQALKAPLMEQLSASVQPLQICPAPEEEALYGGMGALVLKLKNDYETLTRDNLVRLLGEFYEYLLADGAQKGDEVKKLAQGTASWLWNNRKRVPIRYVERTFVVKAPPRKRKPEAAAAAEGPKVPRAPRFVPVTDMPHTREDFLRVPGLAAMLSAPLPPQNDDSADLDEDVAEELD